MTVWQSIATALSTAFCVWVTLETSAGTFGGALVCLLFMILIPALIYALAAVVAEEAQKIADWLDK